MVVVAVTAVASTPTILVWWVQRVRKQLATRRVLKGGGNCGSRGVS